MVRGSHQSARGALELSFVIRDSLDRQLGPAATCAPRAE